EGMADPLRAHDGEARRVDEAEVLVGVLPQQTERPCFGLVMDEYLVEPLRILEVVEEPHRRRMTANHAQERVRLPDPMVCGDQGGCPGEEPSQRPPGAAMPLVVRYLHRKPGAGIDEDPARLHPSACLAAAPHVREFDRDRERRGARPPSRPGRSVPAGARLALPRSGTAGSPRGARGWTWTPHACEPSAPARGPRPRAGESGRGSSDV